MENLAVTDRARNAEYRPYLLEEAVIDRTGWRIPAGLSAALHALLLISLWLQPRETAERVEPPRPRQRVTPLVDPPPRLTQKEPNRKPLSEDLTLGADAIRPPAIARNTARPRTFAPPPPQVTRRETPRPNLPQEPPKVETPRSQAVQIAPDIVAASPPRTVEQPKLVLESPAAPVTSSPGTGRLKVPGGGVQEAVREIARSGSRPNAVGDAMDSAIERGISPAPLPTRPKSSLELLSDPQGIDFKPYLLQVLASVRGNWFAVMPESAKMGQRGRVVIQFAIAREGKITKVVFASESGARALDRAAVAALSASDPLPPLPQEFHGDRVVLQFTFLYNGPR